jgi:hypothetical protein
VKIKENEEDGEMMTGGAGEGEGQQQMREERQRSANSTNPPPAKPREEITTAKVMQFVNGEMERPKVLSIYDSGGQDCFLSLHHLLTAPGGTVYTS